jgi:signal transduction histidine kinase
MPPEVQKRLFTPLYTTKGSADKRQQQKLSGGTGIGLYTILVIIKNHRGTIKLYKTEPMKGTDFLIELPVPREKGET